MQALDEKVKSVMEKGQNMIQKGKQAKRAFICKVCEKEGDEVSIRDQIEANHLEGISIPCDYFYKALASRCSLRLHKANNHKQKINSN